MTGDNGWYVPPSQQQGGGPPPQQQYGRNDYAPPPGPPPGYKGGQPQNGQGGYAPPGGFRPPPQQQQQHHGYNQPPPPQNGGHYGGGPPQHQGGGPPRYGQGPPQGPPPGQYNQHQQHRPPPGGPPPGHHGAPRPQNGGAAGGQGQGEKNSLQQKPFVPPRTGVTRLTQNSWLWTTYTHGGETCCEIGPVCKGEPFYSCKFGVSGRTKLKVGKYEDDGPMVGEVVQKGMITDKFLPTFNGFQTELKKKGYSLTGSVKIWAFEVPINGRNETFEWKPHDKSMTARLTDQKGWELKRKGASESEPPLVIYKDQEGNGLSTKSKMGTIEFLGQSTTGELGDFFPNLVILTLFNLRQQRYIEQWASSVG